MARYRLLAPFWDGYQLHPADSVVELERAPSTAERLDPVEPKSRKRFAPADVPTGEKAPSVDGDELA